MQKCARCGCERPVEDYEGCFVTCSACRIKDTSKGGVRVIFFSWGRYRKPLHIPDQWDGVWDNAYKLQEELIEELP